jgi:tight adherence protein C
MTILVGVLGAVSALGLWWAFAGSGERPLGEVLAGVGRPVPDPVGRVEPTVDDRIGAVLLRVPAVQRFFESRRTELRLRRVRPETAAAELVVSAVCGALGPLLVVGACELLYGIRVPLVVPVWAALLGGLGVAGLLVIRWREVASVRREEMTYATAAFASLVASCLATGRHVSQAMETAARMGGTWPFRELEAAMARGRVRRIDPWGALEELGRELDVQDLVDVSKAIALAGDEGATVRQTMSGKARSMREALITAEESRAAARSEQMGAPAGLLFLLFALFVLYPTLSAFR